MSYALVDDAYKLQVAEQATDRTRKRGPFHAQTREGMSPCWYVLETFSGHEGIAAAHLASRRFAVYSPEKEITLICRGRRRSRNYPIFPGYLFLYEWDIRSNWHRIQACPGVLDLLRYNESRNPAVLPDEAMREIQMSEWKLWMDGKDWSESKSRRPRRRRQKIDASKPFVVTISTKRYFGDLTDVDGARANSLLHKVLGLSCSGS